jgi:hypothetical protein
MGNICSREDAEEQPVTVEVKPQQFETAAGAGGQHAPGGAGGGVQPDPGSRSVLGRWEDIRDHFIFDKVLGRGQFGVTRLVVHRVTGEQSACKSISKRK